MKKIRCLTAVLFCFFLAAPAFAAQPEWTYPIKATTLADPTGLLVLTNVKTLISADFVPHPLVNLHLRATNRGMQLRSDAAEALAKMFKAAEADGYTLYVKSAYRSYQTQNTMYKNRMAKYHKDDGVVAYPGSSDHQTGLAVDILNHAWTQQAGMRPEFSQTAEAKWMDKNCARFGFILRYMEDKSDVTGIIFEPWHFRYVGEEVAAYMMEKHISLEEFTEEYRAAIAEFEKKGGDFKSYVKELNAPPPPIVIGEEDGETEVSLFYGRP